MRLSPNEYRKSFIISDLAAIIREQLNQMEASPLYTTKPTYSPSEGGDVSFANKHFMYMSVNPSVRPHEYMANLRLKTKVR